MGLDGRKRWFAAPIAVAVVAVALGVPSARADVTVERMMRTGGIAGFGAGESTSVEKISGVRKRAVSSMKMSGFLGKMAGDMGGDEITDIAKDAVWRLDHKKKTYTESRITIPKQEGEERGKPEKGEKAEKPNVRVVRNDVTVKETGESKRIGDFDTTRYVVTWVLEVENLDTKERTESTMTSDIWTTPENDATRALQKEEAEFTKAWLKKIGWDMSQQEAQKLGLAMVGAMLGGDDESFRKGAKEVAEKMAKVKGYPIGTGVKWQVKASGGAAASAKDGGGGAEQGGGGVPDLSKGLGGLMSAFGKKAAKGGSEGAGGGEAGEAGGAKPVFESYTEIRKISTGSLPDGDFAPPAGYKKVE